MRRERRRDVADVGASIHGRYSCTIPLSSYWMIIIIATTLMLLLMMLMMIGGIRCKAICDIAI
jgi:hypothetical protein